MVLFSVFDTILFKLNLQGVNPVSFLVSNHWPTLRLTLIVLMSSLIQR